MAPPLRDFIRDIPSYWPVILLWVTLGLLLSGQMARFLETRRIIAFGLFVSLGFVLLATLSPNDPARLDAVSGCDLSRVGFPSISTLISDRDALRNILLFLPLGFTLGLLPWTKRNLIVIVGAFGLTVVIETTQIALADLGRGCETADMIDNNTGLAIGLLAGAVTGRIARSWLR